jgi:p-hydroxybenzoate 3-monooxygenase
MSSRPGVAIVGAGPAGLVVAHLLQREAIPFVVFERQALAELAGRPKAGLVEYRTVQLLAREGIAGSILQFTTEIIAPSSARRTSRCCWSMPP